MPSRIPSLFLLFVLSIFSSSASNLVHSRTSSYYKYIYQLNAKESRAIYKHGLKKVEESFFHHLIDSVPNDSVFNTKLPQGNYLLVWAQKNELQFEFRSYSDLEVMMHNNYADLLLTIADTTGRAIVDASVKIKGSVVKYISELKAYRKSKVNKRGWLQIEYNGFTSYHYIGNGVPKGVRRRKLTSSAPIKYVYAPVRLVAFLPYDLVRTVYNRRPQGLFYYGYKPFKDVYYSIFRYGTTGWIKKLTHLWEGNIYKNYDGYMVYSKPKYKPNDTIRFKAFVTYAKGKPLRKQPLQVELRVDRKNIVLDTIQPNRQGSYDYEFAIHDSLKLKLDQSYTMSLERMNGWDDVISRQFKYEDYELNSVSYSMRTDGMDQLRGRPFYMHVKGEDMNGLNVPDGRVEINMLSGKRYTQLYAARAFLPDTIYSYKQKLDAVGETSILIPDSVLPAMDFNYKLQVIFRTADNERIEKTKQVNYCHAKTEIDLSIANDSLVFTFKNLGIEEKIKGKIIALDKNGNMLDSLAVWLPYKMASNYNMAKYVVATKAETQIFNMSQFTPKLSVSSSRESRKVHIAVNNPNKIWFNYFIYKKDREIAKGYTQDLDTILNPGNAKGCYVALNYQWGGKPYHRTYDIPLFKNQLNVLLRQPKVVYPGQTTNIEVEVTDYKNRPVEDVDLTVFGLTKKFGYSAPNISYFGRQTGSRTMFSNYSFEGDRLFGTRHQLPLSYSRWNSAMSLDTITYYRFTRPEKGVHMELIDTKDKLTQFAPFVYKDGKQQAIHFIYLDYKLLYSSISTNGDPYSLKVYPGHHRLRLRTASEDIIIDSVYFRYASKTLLSVDTEIANKHVAVRETKAEWTDDEKDLIQRKFIRYNASRNRGLTFFEQKDRIYMLNSSGNNNGYYRSGKSNLIVGPFDNDAMNYSEQGMNKMSVDFESSYQYDINKHRIKMKTWDKFWDFRPLSKLDSNKDFHDEVISKNTISTKRKYYSKRRLQDRFRYNIAYVTNKGAGTIGINYKKRSKKDTVQLSNVLLFKDDEPQFMQLFPAYQNKLHNLKKGSYRLLFLMNNGQYFQEKAIRVEANTITAILAEEPDSLLKDSMSCKVNELITTKWAKYSRYNKDFGVKWEAEKEIKSTYQKSQLDYSNARTISGNVLDEDGSAIPGVSIFLKGTKQGTISDMDGNYTIEIPAGEWSLSFAFIGYEQLDVPLSYSDKINVELRPDTLGIDEVVVIGYGVQKKRVVTGSVASVSSNGMVDVLQGRLAGVSVSGAPGSSSIMIRGVSSLSEGKEPLYIVNGIPITSNVGDIDPALIESIEILKDQSAVAIYGSKAANGVVIISTKGGKGVPGLTMENDIEIPRQMNGISSLRSNFLDEAFWQPNLVTGKDGKVAFTTTFPDDITSWSTFALAIGQNKMTGQVRSEVKSFKPISAQLMTPRFLVQGDSISAIGKMNNYMGDTIAVSTEFNMDSIQIFSRKKQIGRLHIDSLPVVANHADTLELVYSLNRDNGYFDGEKREVPVFAQGSKDVVGEFFTLNSDTTITIDLPEGNNNGKFYLESNPIKVLLNETYRMRNYKHLCNEQASSKLISLLNEEKICKHLGIEFKYKSDIDKLIKRLLDSRSEDGLWGWWANMPTRWWITTHVLCALERAKAEGYKVVYEDEHVKYTMTNQYSELSPGCQLDVLRAFDAMKAQVSIPQMINDFNDSCISRVDSMRLTILKQKYHIPVEIDSLVKHRKETLYGNYFWGRPSWSLSYGDIYETVLMYQILKNNGEHDAWLPKIRNYFYEKRTVNGWRNTYESTRIVDMMLPDLLEAHKRPGGQYLKLNIDGEKRVISEYPYEFSIDNTQQVIVEKQGKNPVFVGWHSKFFNPEPERRDKHFVIQSHFERNGDQVESLVAGQKVKLVVDVNVKKKSKFMMLEIPIPSVCSYHNKPQNWSRTQHREYHKEKVSIYYENLAIGKFKLEVELVPRYTGRVVLNPARIEHMYFPVFSGNNEVKKVSVNSEEK